MECGFYTWMLAGMSALSSAMAGALGSFTGGLIVSRLNLQPAAAVKLMIVSTVAFLLGTVVLLFIGCPQANVFQLTYGLFITRPLLTENTSYRHGVCKLFYTYQALLSRPLDSL